MDTTPNPTPAQEWLPVFKLQFKSIAQQAIDHGVDVNDLQEIAIDTLEDFCSPSPQETPTHDDQPRRIFPNSRHALF
jgi:hypothetical protein